MPYRLDDPEFTKLIAAGPEARPRAKETHMALIAGTPAEGIAPLYVPQEDITETLEDGRTIQIAVAGTPLPWAEALRLGLVKQPGAPGPTETKADAPADPQSVEGPEEAIPTTAEATPAAAPVAEPVAEHPPAAAKSKK